jgi:hypothetical protein
MCVMMIQPSSGGFYTRILPENYTGRDEIHVSRSKMLKQLDLQKKDKDCHQLQLITCAISVLYMPNIL